MNRSTCSLVALVVVLLSLSPGVSRAQPYNLSTGPLNVGSGNVQVGVDGFGAFGSCPVAGVDDLTANSLDARYDPVGAPGNIGTMYESGLALGLPAGGPRTFLTAGKMGSTGGLPNPVVSGTATTGTSSFPDASGKLSFNLVQTLAPMFNGAVRTGSILTQTYTITNTTAAPVTFDLVRYIDLNGVKMMGGQFFSSNGTEVLYSDENPPSVPANPVVVAITGIGGTPLAANRFEIKDYPGAPLSSPVVLDIVAGTPFTDAVAPGMPYNVTQGLRNVFTLAASASTTYTTHTIWCNKVADIFPTAPPPPTPGPGILYGITLANQLLTINTAPTAGVGAGLLVGPLSSNMVPPGLSFRGTKLYTWDTNLLRLQQLNPATGATLTTIDLGIVTPGNSGDLAFRGDGIGFMTQGTTNNFWKFDITVPNNTPLPPLAQKLDALAFNAANTLFGLKPTGTQLYTIDQVTAVETPFLGPTGIPAGFNGGGIAFDGGGNLFAAVTSPGNPSFLYSIDLTTGAATLLGNIGFNGVSGLAFYPNPSGNGGGSSPPGSAGSEGSFAGVQDPAGAGQEGSFGQGGGHLVVQPLMGPPWVGPVLAGPYLDSSGSAKILAPLGFAAAPPAGSRLRVFNISGQVKSQANSPQAAFGAAGALAWTVLAALALVGAVTLAKKVGFAAN